jgi:quercetin dioxygenase-like cupin family protein
MKGGIVKLIHYTDAPAETVEDGAKGVKIRWLITERDNAGTFLMRHFHIAPGGHTPFHKHGWEHEVFILGGRGVVGLERRNVPVRPGDAIFIPCKEKHNFRNTGKKPVRMLCLIPTREKRCC